MSKIYNSFYVPEVWEKTPYGGERTTSLLGKLLKERIILLGTPIDEHVANLVMAQLLHLESEGRTRTSRSTSTLRVARSPVSSPSTTR